MKQTLQNITSQIREIKDKYQHEGFEIVDLFSSNSNNTGFKEKVQKDMVYV